MKFLRALKHYAWQMVRGCVQGGATAVTAFIGGSVAHDLFPESVSPLNWKQTLGIFSGAAAFKMWKFLSENPLPDDEGEVQQERTEDLPGQGNVLPGADVKTLVSN